MGASAGLLHQRVGHLLSAGRRLSTRVSYDGKWKRFEDFCNSIIRDEYGQKPRSALPASEATVMLYLGHLSREGKVSEQSLQPYISSINQRHADAGLPKPATGHFLGLLRKGYAAVEAEERGEPNAQRVPVSAELVLAVLRLGLQTQDMHVLRMSTCVVLNFCYFSRADTSVQLLRQHVTIHSRGITVNIHGKTVPRNKACTLTRRHDPASDPDGLVLKLLQRWWDFSSEWQRDDTQFWLLPGEKQQEAPIITEWLTQCARLVGMAPANGEKWTGHSLRSGAASACQALDVSLFYVMSFGIWKSMEAVQRYLNATILPSDEAWLFFGWMRPHFSPSLIRESPARA